MSGVVRDLLAEIERSLIQLDVVSFSVHRGRDGFRGNVRRNERGWVSGPEVPTLREAMTTAIDAALDHSERQQITQKYLDEIEDLFG